MILSKKQIQLFNDITKPNINPNVGVIPLPKEEKTGSPISPIIEYNIKIISEFLKSTFTNIINTTKV